MFYGGGAGSNRSPDKGGPRGRTERFDEMSKQQQLIEQKKREIEAKLEAERQKRAIEAGLGKSPTFGQAAGAGNPSAKLGTSVATNNSSTTVKSERLDDAKPPIPSVFANDGSFLEQFRRLQEQKLKQEQEAKTKTKVKQEPAEGNEYGMPGVKKPLIKIMNPPVGSKSSAASTSDHLHYSSTNSRCNTVPPPPPPPPPPPVRQPERNIDTFNPHQLSSNYNNVAPPPPPPPPPPPSYVRAPRQSQGQGTSGFPSLIVRNFASTVAEKGDQYEDSSRSIGNPLLWFLNRPDSEEYRLYRDLVMRIRAEKAVQSVHHFRSTVPGNLHKVDQPRLFQEFRYDSTAAPKREMEDEESQNGSKKKRSRWGPQDDKIPAPALASNIPPMASVTYPQFISGVPPPPPPPPPTTGLILPNIGPQSTLNLCPGTANIPGITAADLRGPSPKLTLATRTNPELLDYARQSYGTIQLDEEQWKQCEEAYKMNLLFQDIARKKAKDEQLAQAGKFKYEYDSDEEVDDQGTWEHKKRLQEMEKTKQWATELTSQAKGKHHIGDFLPPEELEKFMEKYKAVKEGRQMTQSAYEDFKIAQDNVGFKLLQKMGWVDGQGLGAAGQGITAPIDKGTTGADKQGLGLEQPDEVREDDDEYSAYRKRMMLAYRFRPNPLNNPRRAYY